MLNGNFGGLTGAALEDDEAVAVAMDCLTAFNAAVPAAEALVLKSFAPTLKLVKELEAFGLGPEETVEDEQM